MGTKFQDVVYDDRHGGPFDRGAADSYYSRPNKPHYYVGATGTSEMVDVSKMTETQVAEYNAGYEYNELYGDKNLWD